MNKEKRELQGLEMLNHLEKLSGPKKILNLYSIQFENMDGTWSHAISTAADRSEAFQLLENHWKKKYGQEALVHEVSITQLEEGTGHSAKIWVID